MMGKITGRSAQATCLNVSRSSCLGWLRSLSSFLHGKSTSKMIRVRHSSQKESSTVSDKANPHVQY